MNPKVEEYLLNLSKWQIELTMLRNIILKCGLEEDFKWKHPCYSFQGKNIVLIHDFKEYCAILFFKGVLLDDYSNILVQQTKNVQTARQIRFTDKREIEKFEDAVKNYIYQAVEIEKRGVSAKFKKTIEFEIPNELKEFLKSNSTVNSAFNKLTEGRKRGYIIYFSEPKQSATRINRIEKSIQKILLGKGLNDCICGLSKRMPRCDGSHNKTNKL